MTFEKPSFNLVSTFKESGTKYHVIYDALPGENDPNDNSYLYVVPKVFLPPSGQDMPNGGLNIWMGTFLPLTKPVTLTYTINGKDKQTLIVQPDEWDITNPIPDGPESIKVRHKNFMVPAPGPTRDPNLNGADIIQFEKAYSSNNFNYAAAARFLPFRIPNPSFEVILGSCYERTFDDKRVAKSFKALYPALPTIPHVKFFAGDQVYLDHPATDFLRNKVSHLDLAKRFVVAYEESWDRLSPALSFGANYFISDDHEYYNNYPDDTGFMGMFSFLDLSRNHYDRDYLNQWAFFAKQYFNGVQTTDVIQRFDIGKELSFFIADVRIHRERNNTRFIDIRNFSKLLFWLGNLTTPGVLVIGQPILMSSNSEDYNLADYPDQYKELVEAIAKAPHDIVVLSGDVHFSRFASVHLPRNNKMLYEIIASPLSLLEATRKRNDCNPDVMTTYLSGKDVIEAGGASGWHIGPHAADIYKHPEFFPPETVSTNLERKRIDYEESGTHTQYQVDDPNYVPPTSYHNPPPPVPQVTMAKRTVENFTKIRFFKARTVIGTGEAREDLMMEVKSYRVREQENELPKLDWEIPSKRLT